MMAMLAAMPMTLSWQGGAADAILLHGVARRKIEAGRPRRRYAGVVAESHIP